MKDGASLRQMSDDLKRYKSDLNDASNTIKIFKLILRDSNYRNKKIISQLERDVKDKYTKLDEFVKSTDSEIARLRKDRDSMRGMYEQTNSLLSSCQKPNFRLIKRTLIVQKLRSGNLPNRSENSNLILPWYKNSRSSFFLILFLDSRVKFRSFRIEQSRQTLRETSKCTLRN